MLCNHHISECVQELRPVKVHFSNQTARRAGGRSLLYVTWGIRKDLYMFFPKALTGLARSSWPTFLVERQIKQLNWRILSKCFCSSNSLLSCPDPFSFICPRLRNPQNMTFF